MKKKIRENISFIGGYLLVAQFYWCFADIDSWTFCIQNS